MSAVVNRTDLALGYADIYWADDADAEWILRHGRKLRRRARESRTGTLRYQSTPIATRLRGWRRYGQPRGYAFAMWSPWMTVEGFRAQLHLGVLAGSDTAGRHLSQGLINDVLGAA